VMASGSSNGSTEKIANCLPIVSQLYAFFFCDKNLHLSILHQSSPASNRMNNLHLLRIGSKTVIPSSTSPPDLADLLKRPSLNTDSSKSAYGADRYVKFPILQSVKNIPIPQDLFNEYAGLFSIINSQSERQRTALWACLKRLDGLGLRLITDCFSGITAIPESLPCMKNRTK
jgi:hypothetical protein